MTRDDPWHSSDALDASSFPDAAKGNRRLIAFLLLFLAFCLLVILQGWRSRIPRFDVAIVIDSAQRLIDRGEVPNKGILVTFVSYSPPGAAWFVVPGLLIFDDPRLFEYVGSIGLYVGTLLGIFFLARRYCDAGIAFLAVALYGCSELGLLAGSTLFLTYDTRCFYVWMIYCISKWVDDCDGNYLAAALLIWATGMYVFMEIAPAVFVVPVAWFLYRVPIRVAPLAIVAILSTVVWYPYLRFEAGRDFIDVRSQVFRQSLAPVEFSQAWCDPSVAPSAWQLALATAKKPQPPEPMWRATRRWASTRVNVIVSNLLTSFRSSRIRGAPIVLLALTLVGMAACLLSSAETIETRQAVIVWRRRITWISHSAGVLAVLLNEFVLTQFFTVDAHLEATSVWSIRVAEALMAATAIVSRLWRGTIAARIAAVQSALSARSTNVRVLAISTLVPWLVLFWVAEDERRFWWIWPLQMILLAVAVRYVTVRVSRFPFAPCVASLFIVFLVANNSVMIARLHDWARNGWSGAEANAVQAIDAAAALVRSSGGNSRASIGYEVDVRRFVAIDHIVDPRYKVGTDLDMLLWYRHGITNTDRCAEGFAATDTLRIVQVGTDDAGRQDRIENPRSEPFNLIRGIGVYRLLQRE